MALQDLIQLIVGLGLTALWFFGYTIFNWSGFKEGFCIYFFVLGHVPRHFCNVLL
jgi:hypothetical protein